MAEKNAAGLVSHVTELLARLPAGFTFTMDDAASGTATGAERRVRLALRIAMLRAGPVPLPLVVEVAPPPPAEPVVILLPPEPTPPPRPKPARISMSTVRLEDAAFLLAAASAPSEPEPHTAVDRPKTRHTGGVSNLGDAFAALSALQDDAPASDPDPVAPSDQEEVIAKPAPAKTKRRSGSISAADGMANAAAALASMKMDDAPPAKKPSATEAAMAAGFAAFDEPD